MVNVRPTNSKCTTPWITGVVTSLISNTAVKADAMARCVGDLRMCHSVNKYREAVGVDISLTTGADLDADGDGGRDDRAEYDEPVDDSGIADGASGNNNDLEGDNGELVADVAGTM